MGGSYKSEAIDRFSKLFTPPGAIGATIPIEGRELSEQHMFG